MVAAILDGLLVAKLQQDALRDIAKQRAATGQRLPGLAVILVGNDPASTLYVKKKEQTCEKIGFLSEIHHLPHETDQHTLCERIDALNHAAHIDGILVQLPLPEHIDSNAILERIRPSKDVDGFHPYNLGRLAQQRPLLRPCTPYGIIQLMQHYQLSLKGRHAVIIGASNIVGRPMALECLLAGASVTICHRFTEDLAPHIRLADILIVAIGKPGIIQSEWIPSGAIVIDVGINRLPSGQVIGDIDFASAQKRAAWITPVPGGVGPMTVTTLLQNTLEANTAATS